MLPKKRRVNTKSFKKIFKKGKMIKSDFFTLKILYTDGNLSKFSIVVPISVERKAAKRNKLKRQGRYILAKNIDDIKKGVEMAIFLKKETKGIKFVDFERELVSLMEKTGLLNKK